MAAELMETLKEAITAYTGLSPTTFFTVLAAGIAVYYIVSVLFSGSSHRHQQHSPMSSEQDRSIADSSSSSSQSIHHEVFLSFRGEDTRKNFVDHLYKDLVQQGIQTYKDDETLPRGERIGPALLKAIQESRIAVVVFSQNYADSSWCLDELAHIMECVDTNGQIVIPIFYHVDPSDVRKQKGKYGEAFSKHKRENKHKVETWRKALEKAGNLSGWVINETENSYEAKCIKEIVDTISNRLPTLSTNVNKNLIGIETRLRDLKSKLNIGSDGVRIIGIWGVGGGGKTTLASAAYAELSHQFEAHCFLQNIREESNKHGLEKLQEKILSVALKTKDVVVGSEIEGRSTIQRRLCHKRVLVVLDDVDDLEQLEALAGSHDWFGEGSRIIITTRDKHLLSSRAHTYIYEVSLLSQNEAIKLFNRHAYNKDKPIEDYEKLSLRVVSYAGGLPLALKVLGSFLYDKDKDEWKSTLAKLKSIPEEKVMDRLKISYDGLESDQKELFLDIACFMRKWEPWDMDSAMKVLDACNLHPVIGLKVLEQKSLIKVSEYGSFEMHDLIEEMAHYIVRGEHPNHPEKHSRIWREEDVEEFCAMGAAAPSMENEVLANLPTHIRHPGLFDVVANMKNLRWIAWDWYPASSFPSNFQPTKLRCLMLRYSEQEKLWEGCKSLPNLKILDLGGSCNLITTPDFEGLPCLERLILSDCESLEEIHPSIRYHKRLVFVDMGGCRGLKRFPPIIQMKKLETLILSECRELQQFPDIQSNMDSLVTLDLSFTKIEIIPPSVGRFCTNLVSFDLLCCEKLKRIEGNFHLLKSLKDLDLTCCEGLQYFHQDRLVSLKLHQFPRFLRKLNLSYCKLGDGDIPSDIFCELLNLQLLDLSGNNFSRLPSSLSQSPCLKYLNLSKCNGLVELPDLPSSIAILHAKHCDSLEIVRDLLDYKWLWKVSLCERTNKRVLLSLLEENAVKDRFMSVLIPNVQPSSIYTRLVVTLQLPHNWYSDFSGFLLSLRAPYCGTYHIVIKQEMSTDHPEEFGEDWEKHDYERVGYVPFSSLRHIPWFNPTYTKNISFQAEHKYNHMLKTGLNIELVRSKSKIGDLSEPPIDYSECWDEEYEERKTFEIIYDSNSSAIQISWFHQELLLLKTLML